MISFYEQLAWRAEMAGIGNNFFLARVIITCMCAMVFISALPYGLYTAAIILLLMMPMLIGMLHLIDMIEIIAGKSMTGRNPFRNHWGIRVGITIVAVYLVIRDFASLDLIMMFVLLLFSVVQYFIACDALPPAWKAPRKVARKRFSLVRASM